MNTVRWGVIGAGDIVRKRVAPALRDTASSELVSICRRDADLAEQAAADLGAERWFADWRELIDDPEIDAVYIATPVYLHREQTVAVASAGKHVLCEKPMAMNVEECDEMIAACEANGVKLSIAYYRRFYPVLERVKQIIASGEIGRVTLAQIDAFEYFEPPPEHPRSWLLDPRKSGGGPMMDFGCHRIEVLQDLFGDVDDVKSVVSNSVFGRAVEDTAIALMHFANGVTATVSVTHAAAIARDSVSIFGTNGSLRIPSLNEGSLVIDASGGERSEHHPPDPNFHQPLINDFVRAVLDDRPPRVSGHDGRQVNVVLERIYAGDAAGAVA